MASARRAAYAWYVGIALFLILGFTVTDFALLIKTLTGEETQEYNLSTTCSDGNTCTVDYTFEAGCANFPVPNGQPCISICHTNGTSDTCSAGVCTATHCAGTCTTSANCPTITGAASYQCVDSSCIYQSYVTPTAPLLGDTGFSSSAMVNLLCASSVSTSQYLGCLQFSGFFNATVLNCYSTFACNQLVTF